MPTGSFLDLDLVGWEFSAGEGETGDTQRERERERERAQRTTE